MSEYSCNVCKDSLKKEDVFKLDGVTLCEECLSETQQNEVHSIYPCYQHEIYLQGE